MKNVFSVGVSLNSKPLAVYASGYIILINTSINNIYMLCFMCIEYAILRSDRNITIMENIFLQLYIM